MKYGLLVALAVAGCATTNGAAPPAEAPSPSTASPRAAPVKLSGPPLRARPEVPPGRIIEGKYHVCLDEAGRVRTVDPVEPIAGALDVEETLREWSWFVARREEGCFDAPVIMATAGTGTLTSTSASSVRAEPTQPIRPPLPLWYRFLNAGKTVALTYRACAGSDARVHEVTPIAGDITIDDNVRAAITAASWTIAAGPGEQAPYCFTVPVRLNLPSLPNAALTLPPLPPSTPFAVAPTPRPGVSVVIIPEAVTRPAPHLPLEIVTEAHRQGGGSFVQVYRQCIQPDGTVAEVQPLYGSITNDAAIQAALRGWQFRPMALGVCLVKQWTYTVN
jgi:hypothetical protein